MQGKSKRGKEEINIIDVNQADQIGEVDVSTAIGLQHYICDTILVLLYGKYRECMPLRLSLHLVSDHDDQEFVGRER